MRPSPGPALVVVAAVAAVAWPTWAVVAERTAARVEAARAARAAALEEGAQALADRVDRARTLARAVADAALARGVLPGPRAAEADWRGLDALLDDPEALLPPDRRGARDVLSVALLDGADAALAAAGRRAPPPGAPPPAVVRRARAAPDGLAVDLELDGPAALLRAAIVDPVGRGAVVVDLDATADVGRIAAAAPGGRWSLLEVTRQEGAERERRLAGAEGLARPPALGARRWGAVVEPEAAGDVVAAALQVSDTGRPPWELRARVPSDAPAEPLERVVLALAVVVPALVAGLALAWRSAEAARQRSLLERERFLQAVVDAIGDVLVVVDRDLRVARVNAAAARRLGRDLVGRTYAEGVAARRAMPGAEVEAVLATLRGAGPQRLDEVEEPATRTLWQVVRFPLLDPDGQATGVVELARDVTETRRLQQQLIHSEKLSILGEMAAGIAHEVNNPVGVVSMFAQLAQEEAKEALGAEHPVLEKLRTIEEQAQAVGDIVQGLLRFSRKGEGARARVDVRRAIERALSIAGHQKAHRGVAIERRLDVEPPPVVLGEEGQLAQVVLNLVVNASHAMKGQGSLVLEVRRRGPADPPPPGRPYGEPQRTERVEVRVTDTGHGIGPEVLDRLSEPFFTTKPTGEGTGLGLSVSFAIVREHGGLVWVASEVGKGTTFTIDLPAAAGEDGPPA